MVRTNPLLTSIAYIIASSCVLIIWHPAKAARSTKTMSQASQQNQPASIPYEKAYQHPEYILSHQLNMPITPNSKSTQKLLHLSLQEAILLALRYNPNVQNKKIDRIMEKFNLRVAENNFELQYALTGSSTLSHTRAWGTTTSNQSYTLSPNIKWLSKKGTQYSATVNNNYDGVSYHPQLQLDIKQPLLRGADPIVVQQGLLNTQDNEKINKLSLQQQIMSTITTVIQNYRAVIENNNNIKIQQQSLKDARKTYWDNQEKIKAGTLERTANIQQNYQIESLKLSLLSAQNSREEAIGTLLQTIGLEPSLQINIPNNVSVSEPKIPKLHATLNYALHHNISYLNALINYKIAKRSLHVALDSAKWQLDADAQATVGTNSGDSSDRRFSTLFNRHNRQSVGLNLSIPIDNYAIKQQIIDAKLQLEQDRISLASDKRSLETLVRNDIIDITSLVKQIELAKIQVQLAKRSYQLQKRKRQAGMATDLDVTTSQDNVISARNSLINNKINYLNAMSNLQNILGTTLAVWNIDLRY